MMVEQASHPGPLPIGSADSAAAEREKRSQLFGKTIAESCLKAFGLHAFSQRLFPLPEGEGQGEEERDNLSFIRKARRKFPQVASLAMLLLAGISAVPAQQIPAGHATEFTSSTYYEPPHEQQIRLRLSGAEASPLPGGLLEVKSLRVETFTEAGKAEAVVSAPHCLYAPLDGVASSPGRLELRTGDGKFRVEGEGFLWRQADSLLIISNRVRTVIDMPVLQPPA
jgi:hypothetical protein